MTNTINPANSGPGFYETSKYRCLVDARKQSDMLYLLLCGVDSCMPDYEFRTGGREGYHLHVILSGKGVLCVNGTQTALHYGQMFITKPDENAWYRADRNDPWTYCWMAYGGSNALRYTEAAGFGSGVNWLNCGVDPSRFYAIVNRALEQPDLNLAICSTWVCWRSSSLLPFNRISAANRPRVGKRSIPPTCTWTTL